MNEKIKAVGATNQGKVRKNNQDYFYVPSEEDVVTMGIVADGMGGYKGGDVASHMCVQTVVQYINNKYKDASQIEELLFECVNVANTAVFDYAQEDEYLKGMGTTLVMAVFIENKVYIANVGDSRAYHITKDYNVKQISVDHSLVQEYINIGKITKEEAKTHAHRHIITRALGTGKEVKMDLFEITINEGDFIFLCSDGMYEYIDDEMIGKIMEASPTTDEAIKTFIDMSNNAGGADNITIVIANYEESEQ